MAWPPPIPPATRNNALPQLDDHPSDHNLIHQALADILGYLAEAAPVQVQAVGGGTTATGGYSSWVAGAGIPAPDWATSALMLVTMTAVNHTADDTVTFVRGQLGPAAGSGVFSLRSIGTDVRQAFTFATEIDLSLPATAPVPAVSAVRNTGSGLAELDAASDTAFTVWFRP